MPRRGKAATRQARQRRARTTQSAAARPVAQPATAPAAVASAPETPRVTPAQIARSRSDRLWRPEISSQLSERALAEYHYVGRDLRNIGVAAGLMGAVLLAAFVVVRVLGIGPG